jgi:hypothetical protein
MKHCCKKDFIFVLGFEKNVWKEDGHSFGQYYG